MMKREIEFKAWNKVGKFWLQWGDFIDYENDQIPIAGKDYRIFNDKELILCQYIGLKDLKGTKVYEGDIIMTHGVSLFPYKYSIAYNNKNSEYVLIDAKNNEYFIHTLEKDKFEVIGNIHENKEPLK